MSTNRPELNQPTYTVKQLAVWLQVKADTVLGWIHSGQLEAKDLSDKAPADRDGGSWKMTCKLSCKAGAHQPARDYRQRPFAVSGASCPEKDQLAAVRNALKELEARQPQIEQELAQVDQAIEETQQALLQP